MTTLAELPEALSFIFDLSKYPSDLLVWKKSSAEEVKKVLPELSEVLNKISVQALTKANWNKRWESGLKRKQLLQRGGALAFARLCFRTRQISRAV